MSGVLLLVPDETKRILPPLRSNCASRKADTVTPPGQATVRPAEESTTRRAREGRDCAEDPPHSRPHPWPRPHANTLEDERRVRTWSRCRSYWRRAPRGGEARFRSGVRQPEVRGRRRHGGAQRRLPAAAAAGSSILAADLGFRRRILAWPVGGGHPVGGSIPQTVSASTPAGLGKASRTGSAAGWGQQGRGCARRL